MRRSTRRWLDPRQVPALRQSPRQAGPASDAGLDTIEWMVLIMILCITLLMSVGRIFGS